MIKYLKNIIKKILSLLYSKLVNTQNEDNQNFPIEADNNIRKFINIANQFSMTGKKRMFLLSQAVLNVKNQKLEGDFVECGVWRGGNILLFKLLNEFYSLNKTIYAYDTFDGMTTPEDIDKDYKQRSAIKEMKLQHKSENLQNIHVFQLKTLKKIF